MLSIKKYTLQFYGTCNIGGAAHISLPKVVVLRSLIYSRVRKSLLFRNGFSRSICNSFFVLAHVRFILSFLFVYGISLRVRLIIGAASYWSPLLIRDERQLFSLHVSRRSWATNIRVASIDHARFQVYVEYTLCVWNFSSSETRCHYFSSKVHRWNYPFDRSLASECLASFFTKLWTTAI